MLSEAVRYLTSSANATLHGALPALSRWNVKLSLCLPVPTDGVFGRCQKVPAMDTYRYEVSPGALLHLRVTLEKLSRAGRQSGHSCLDLGMDNGSWASAVQVRPEWPAPGRALHGVCGLRLGALACCACAEITDIPVTQSKVR